MFEQKCTSEDQYEIDIWNFENVKNVVDDPIKLGQGAYYTWKSKYYTYYYSVCSHYDRTNLVNQMCKNYIEGLHWITKYYFESCASNIWQYDYYHSPFASDIAAYLRLNKNIIIKFPKNITIYPIVQLLSVIPPEYKNLLPKPYQRLMEFGSPILDLFPIHVKIDELYKYAQHKCIPYVPSIDIERIIQSTDNIKLNYLEEDRNKILGNFIYTK
jgi:5'-3' exonuclease